MTAEPIRDAISAEIQESPGDEDETVVIADKVEERAPSYVERGAILDELQELEDEGFGKYVVGRRGKKTRLVLERKEKENAIAYLKKQTSGNPTKENPSNRRRKTTQDNGSIRFPIPLKEERTAFLEMPKTISPEEAEKIAQVAKALASK